MDPYRVEVEVADYADKLHRHGIVSLMDGYARDPMGGGCALEPERLSSLCDHLQRFPGALTLLAFSAVGQPIGLLTAFTGFSTFRCQPLFNIHDVFVSPEYRGLGIARQLLATLQAVAEERDYCKLTLEVLSNNYLAQSVYRHFGFAPYSLDPAAGQALFWEKTL